MANVIERAKEAWNVFTGRDSPSKNFYYGAFGDSWNPSRQRRRILNERSVITSVYNQIAVDCSSINIKHVRLDDDDRYSETIEDSLNYLFTSEANIDQTGRSFVRDIVESLLDEGFVALVPIETIYNPNETESFKVCTARVGKIVEWFPSDVRVEVYDELSGTRQQVVVGKKYTPIIENPFYTTMNEPNSTYKRLLQVMAQLDRLNEESSSGKLDMIIQLPFSVKSETRKRQAEERRKDIIDQLTGSKYGIAYTDVTEKVIQLNRSLENNLWEQLKTYKEDLFNQLGFSPTIFNGTADEKTMLNYNNRTIEPIMSAIVEEVERKWISKTARSQGQAMRFFRDPFKLVPTNQLAEIADKYTRNEIATSNEMRTAIGMKPFDDPKADMLINSNLNQSSEEIQNMRETK